MRRVWKFILALSVTPLMTAACLLILAWMTWRAGAVDRGATPEWHVGKIVESISGRMSIQTMIRLGGFSHLRPSANTTYVIEDGADLRIVDYQTIMSHAGNAVVLRTDGYDISRHGLFAVTREESTSTSTIMKGMQIVEDPELAAKLAAKFAEHPTLKQHALLVLQGKITTIKLQWDGLAYNALAVMLLLLCVYSMQWVWKGARMPWGKNAEWERAAHSQNATWRDVMRRLWRSPLATVICLVAFGIMVYIVKVEPLANWHRNAMKWVTGEFAPAYPRRAISIVPVETGFMVHVINEPKRIIERTDMQTTQSESWSYAFGDEFVDYSGSLAPTRCRMLPLLRPLLDRGETAHYPALRQTVEQAFLDLKLMTPADVPTAWSDQHTRHNWRGYAYNVACGVLLLAGVHSCIWMFNGVVWPWNAWRLRQNVCQSCGYSRLGLTVSRCPECGQEASTALPVESLPTNS